jgi:hypothetical protein
MSQFERMESSLNVLIYGHMEHEVGAYSGELSG